MINVHACACLYKLVHACTRIFIHVHTCARTKNLLFTYYNKTNALETNVYIDPPTKRLQVYTRDLDGHSPYKYLSCVIQPLTTLFVLPLAGFDIRTSYDWGDTLC